jgi:hypothetical protein
MGDELLDLSDLAAPRLPWTMRAANGALRPFAGRVRLDDASVLAAATKRAKLDDFGPDTFRDGLAALTRSLDTESGLSPVGRVLARQMVVGLLVARLRLYDLIARHPEILDEPIEAPIFVVGLPRTGTTHLHTTLAQDERLRSMPYWESLEPIPDPTAAPRGDGEPDPRIKRCATSLKLVHHVAPHFPAMHEMTAEGPHEEIALLAVELESMFFEAGYDVPGYAAWYESHDQTTSYRFLRTMLQALQWLRGGRRWVLKSPQHLEQLPVLLDVFPDAIVVQTHRDPVAVMASLVTMEAYTRRIQHAGPVDLDRVGAHWSGRIERMLRRSVDDRARIPDGRVLDVRFHELMADQLGALAQIEEAAGLSFDSMARRSITRYVDANPRGRHGKLEYDLRRFGIDPVERREAMRFYTDRFELPYEL